LVSNGTTATITAGGLIPDTYHWRARTVDSSGAVSQWVSFGNNADSATDLQVVKTSTPPNIPFGLGQFQADGTAVIGVGASTPDTIMVFRGAISGADAGEQLKLEIELRRLAEYGGGFTGAATHESIFLNNGATATITAGGLIPDAYHWRARTVNGTGKASDWISYGGNADVAADFRIVSNGLPNIPAGLAQYGSGGQPINAGGMTSDTTVIFRARLSDPDSGQPAKLQLELRRTSEYGGDFIGVPTAESKLVGNGDLAEIVVGSLVNDKYHWRVRTVDSVGAASSWVSFGTSLAATDFIVTSASIPTTPLKAFLAVDRRSGNAPLSVAFNISAAGGSSSYTYNYALWWDCRDVPVNMPSATTTCGPLPDPPLGTCASAPAGYKCNAISAISKQPVHLYDQPGVYQPTLIIEGAQTMAWAQTAVIVSSTETTAPNFKLPLPGGRSWLLTTEYGTRGHLGDPPLHCTDDIAGNFYKPEQGPDCLHHAHARYSIDLINRFKSLGTDGIAEDVAVLAAADGTIEDYDDSASDVWKNPTWGNFVKIRHADGPDGFYSYYLHLKKGSVARHSGSVKAGDAIGVMGDTGEHNGERYPLHLHFEITYKGRNDSKDEGQDEAAVLEGVLIEGLRFADYHVGAGRAFYSSSNVQDTADKKTRLQFTTNNPSILSGAHVRLVARADNTQAYAVHFVFYCNRFDSATTVTGDYQGQLDSTTGAEVAFEGCVYLTPGIYNPKVIIQVGNGETQQAQTTVQVASPTRQRATR
jgi:hypothetical protein